MANPNSRSGSPTGSTHIDIEHVRDGNASDEVLTDDSVASLRDTFTEPTTAPTSYSQSSANVKRSYMNVRPNVVYPDEFNIPASERKGFHSYEAQKQAQLHPRQTPLRSSPPRRPVLISPDKSFRHGSSRDLRTPYTHTDQPDVVHQPEESHGLSSKGSRERIRYIPPPPLILREEDSDSDRPGAVLLDSRMNEPAIKPGSRKFQHRFQRRHDWRHPDEHMQVVLNMPNIFAQFLKEELHTSDSLWDLVVLTGHPQARIKGHENPGSLWATTCGEYIERAWPQSAEIIHELVRKIQLQANQGTKQSMSLVGNAAADVSISCSHSILPTGVMELSLDCNANVLTTLSVVQGMFAESSPSIVNLSTLCSLTYLSIAISWLFAILQTGTKPVPYACSVTLESRSREHHVTRYLRSSYPDEEFSIDVANLSPLTVPYQSSCWMPLFPRTPCPLDFASASMPGQMQGVEMRFELLCLLCGLEYMAQDEEGLLLFGAESLVYPVQQVGNCVQWHLQHCDPTKEEQHRISGERLRTLDIESLCEPKNRHFLGLWPQSSITLGTEAQSYQSITWSSAETVQHENVRDGFSYGAAVSLKGILSLKWDQTYKVANSRKPVVRSPVLDISPHCSGKIFLYEHNFDKCYTLLTDNLFEKTMKSLDSRLHSSRNEPVLLYSPSERRAWIVPFMSVFWHLLRAQADTKKRLGYDVPPCEKSGNGGEAAFDCFMACRTDPARKPANNQRLTELEKKETIQDFAEDIWNSMDHATRQSCLRKQLFRNKLIGFELADIATCSPYMTLREHGLDFTTRGSWAPLLDRVRLTFFYEGLSDPILPSDRMIFDGACGDSIWRTTPKDFDLLTASLPCLAFLARDQNAGRNTLTRLAPDSYWSSPQNPGQLFATCGKSHLHVCSRLQELRPENRARDPQVLISEAEKDGAVVFRFKYGITDILTRGQRSLAVRTLSSENSVSDTPSSGESGQKTRTPASSDRRYRKSSDSGYSSSPKPSTGKTHEGRQSVAVISEEDESDARDGTKHYEEQKERRHTRERVRTKHHSSSSRRSEAKDDSTRDEDSKRQSRTEKRHRDSRDSGSFFGFSSSRR